MQHKLPYKITDNVYALGHDLFISYLVKGNPCALLDLGISGSVPLIQEQLKEINVKPEEIGYLVVMHAHWDHVCGLPYLKQLFPGAEVLGSEKAYKILSKPKIVKQFRENDEQYSLWYKERQLIDKIPEFIDYEILPIDRIIGDGETISLGEIEIQFLATPGHSPCVMTAYIPSEKITIISDTIGCYMPREDDIMPLFFQSVNKTLNSLQRLKSLDSEIIAYCHDSDMIFYGHENISQIYQRIEEEILKLKQKIEQMAQTGSTEEEMLDEIFQATYKGFLTKMYQADYIKSVSPFMLKAVLED